MRASILIGLAITLVACEVPRAPPVDPPPAPTRGPAPLELGHGDELGAFVPYEGGADVTLVEGAQGGFHVWLRYRYGGDDADRVHARLERTAHRLADDALVLRTSAEVTVARDSMALPMFMCPSPVGLSVIDQPIVFSLDFTDDDGAPVARGDVTLVPRCPEASREFCLRICTG